MAITLSQLCRNADKKYSMKLIAGKEGIDNSVRWVHMVEDVQVPDFLHGNELIFTTGIGHTGNEWLLPFVKALKENNAVGIVINIGPYINAVPPKVIVYCQENGFPLFTLPWQIHIIDITYDFCRRIIKNEETETSIAESFRNLIFNPQQKEGYSVTLERMGFAENSVYTIIAISAKFGKTSDFVKNSRPGIVKLLRNSRYPTAVFVQDDALVAIRQNLSIDDEEKFIESLVDADEKLNIGISEQGAGYSAVPQCYKQAVSALAVSGITGRCPMMYNEAGVYKLLFGIERTTLASYVNSVLGTLIQSDSLNSTDYVKVLKTYLECSRSVQQTADILNIHRNTVNNKIKLIRELIGVEMNDEEEMKLLLAIRAKEVLEVNINKS